MKNQKIFLFSPCLFFLGIFLLVTLNDLQGQVELDDGLVGHFPLDDLTGTDESPFQLNGTPYNVSVDIGHEQTNNALFFNGINTYLNYGTNNRNITSTVSVSAWIKTTIIDTVGFIVSKYNWREDRGFHIFVDKEGRFKISGRNNGGEYIRTASQTIVNDGKWHHVVGTVNHNTWEVWVDGRLEQTTISDSPDPLISNTEPLSIGYYPLGIEEETPFYFLGNIDNVRIYNRVLNPEEIAQLKGNIPSEKNGLVAYFPLNGNSTDEGIFSLESNPFNVSADTGIEGTETSALSFDGIDAHINGGNSNRNIVAVVSISVWIQTTTTTQDFILSKYNWREDRGFVLNLTENGFLRWAGRNRSEEFTSILSENTINDGQWHHILGSIESNTWQLWIDGNLEKTVLSNSPNPLLQNTEPLGIGYYPLGLETETPNYFSGKIDEVRVYNRTLTEEERTMLTNNTIVNIEDVSPSNTNTHISLFPNPTSNLVYISIKGIPSSNLQKRLIRANGQEIPFKTMDEQTLDISSLGAGIYFVVFYDLEGKLVGSKRLVIEK